MAIGYWWIASGLEDEKETAQIDLWLKAVAPSTELRKWFGHDPERFDAFKDRYLQELEKAPAKVALAQLNALVAEQETVTLLYGAKNEEQKSSRDFAGLTGEGRMIPKRAASLLKADSL